MTEFGITQKGETVESITIGDGQLEIRILTFGAIVQDVRFAGLPYSLALGSDRLSDYEDTMRYFGAVVGPIANRISNARVRLEGMMYELERNENGQVHLHSGAEGVHRRVWQITGQSAQHVELTCALPDGAAGLPGQRSITVTYEVEAPATLRMTIDGLSDATSCMNFASHIYWNLDGTDTIAGHQLQLAANQFLPVNDMVCPTGEVCDVADTDMDFRTARALVPGKPPLDHNFCLSPQVTALRDVVWVTGNSGNKLTVATTQPGVQIHDASGSQRPHKPTYEGLVIEPQHWPDAPNNPQFPTIKIGPDNPYHQVTEWRFEKPDTP